MINYFELPREAIPSRQVYRWALKIQLHEVLGSAAQESSNAWNNAGTGHAALCELNYTPQESDGSIDISKALQVNTEFDLSRQFWAYLVKKGAIKDPQSFIHSVPHMSFVRGLENRTFLKKRFEALSAHPLYYGMEYSEDKKQIGEWIPLVIEGRDASDIVTATRMVTGTDVDYGALTEELLASLSDSPGRSASYLNWTSSFLRAPAQSPRRMPCVNTSRTAALNSQSDAVGRLASSRARKH